MALIESTFLESLAAIRVVACGSSLSADDVRALHDLDLLDAQRLLAEVRRSLDAHAALVAGEIAHRSRRELGYQGLAQREGFRTAEKLVQHQTGSTARDAGTLVTVGTLMHDAEPAVAEDGVVVDPGEPWLVPLGLAVASGSVSAQAAQSIRTGLGSPSESVTVERLTDAVHTLLAEASLLNADALLVRARQIRDDIDLAGVALREQQIHEQRCIRRVRRANGLSRYIVDPDLEGAAFWDDLYDRVTAPRRGNVTFLSEQDRAWAETASGANDTDQRTVDQYVHDTFTDLLRIAVATDSPRSRGIIGTRAPSVRVLVTADALHTSTGAGHIEGVATPVSIATVERLACTNGTIDVTFDNHGNGIDLGREQRLFSTRQRLVLAARDGGCRMPDCDRPPEWCEAHHIDHWHRDTGPTNLDRGVLLCRHHHMLMHNNGWEISHDGTNYWLTPPADIDAAQAPRRMPSKSAALRALQARSTG